MTEDDAVVHAVQGGDEATFASLAERHRRELRVHCYRMLGSLEDAEDLVQESFLRAWRRRTTFQGRATFRAWLYRIATNACLDFLSTHRRRPLVRAAIPAPRTDAPLVHAPPHVAWLQPFPDALLEPVGPMDDEPDAAAVSRETIELAFIIAMQHLPPRQRAALILRDVLGWSTDETASLLEVSIATVKSALQRARPTMRRHLPPGRQDWAPTEDPSAEDRRIVDRFIEANERGDIPTLVALLREDAWQTMPPYEDWFGGRDAMIAMWSAAIVGPQSQGTWRLIPTKANRQPAVANYLRATGEREYRASNLDVLRIEHGRIAEVTTFDPGVFRAFGLPLTLRRDPS